MITDPLKRKGRSTHLYSGLYLHNSLSYRVYYGSKREYSPVCIEILDKFTNEINAMRSIYSRTFAFRFDLHIPEGMSVDKSNSLISELFSIVKGQIQI